jgi:hypothetical protein
MRGRKRKFKVERQPNGQARRKAVDVKAIAQTMPHRQEVRPEIRHDPLAETKLGRLRLAGRITQPQYEAGDKYADIVRRYRAVISAPGGEVSMAGVIVGPWGGSGAMDDEEATRRKDQYNAAFEALECGAGNRSARAVAHVAVYNRLEFDLTDLKRGLTVLAEHFGLTRPVRSANAINRR